LPSSLSSKPFARLAILAALFLVRCSGSAGQPHPRRPLNVLLITVDTLRADALGAYGHASALTPWIDKLARDGVRFDRAHAHNVVTLPSHANLLSGWLPIDHGVRDNSGFRFPQSIDTIATILKARGYRTGAFVSAFPLDARFGLARGFDEYDDRFVDTTPRPAFLDAGTARRCAADDPRCSERPLAERPARTQPDSGRAWRDRDRHSRDVFRG